MEEIKDLVAQALEQKHVLSKLKAELRAQVFITIDEQERSNGAPGLGAKTDNPRRTALLSSTAGKLLVVLVHEFLEWCGMEFTLKVFRPEMGYSDTSDRQALAAQLGVSKPSESPLLMHLLNQQQTSGGSPTALADPLSAAPTAAARKPVLQPLKDEDVHKGPTKPLAPAAFSLALPAQSAAASVPQALLQAPTGAVPPKAGTTATAGTAAVSAVAFGYSAPQLAQAAPLPTSAQGTSVHDHSYADDIDVDIDDDLEGAEILDDEEEYATVFGTSDRPQRRASSSGGGGLGVPGSNRRRSSSSSGHNLPAAPTASATAAAAAAEGADAVKGATLEDANASHSLSGSFPPGRMRPNRPRLASADNSSLQEDFRGMQKSAGAGLQPTSGDLTMSGDRSFGISHELAGLAPPADQGLGDSQQSGGMSFGSEPTATNNRKAMPTRLPADHHLLPGKLEPLGGKAPLPGKLFPLATLNGSPGTHSPTSPGATPVAKAPATRKDANDIKAELRKAGLLNSDSMGLSGGESDVSLDLPDGTAALGGGITAPTPQQHPAKQPQAAASSKPGAGTLRPVMGGVYDAEVSISQSMDMQADMMQEGSHISVGSDPTAPRGGSGTYQLSKGLSMDMRETGLSTSDKSGDLGEESLGGADLLETAEWV